MTARIADTYALAVAHWSLAALAGLLSILASGPVAEAQAVETPLLRVFLLDGSSLTSYGEWARLDSSVVFSLPLDAGPAPDLQLITLPADRVDWVKTERYAHAARAVHYAATRAEEDYAQFSNQVAAVLTGVAREPDRGRRLTIAESARAALAQWPSQHYGYRAAEVRQMLGLLDEVVSDLRAAAGKDSFAVDLVAATEGPNEPLLPPPSPAQLAEELLSASSLAASPVERVTLLERLVGFIDRAAGVLPDAWAASIRTLATATIGSERTVDAAYGKLSTSVLDRATARTKAADVRGLERLRAETLKSDERLGGRRPAQVSALLSAIDAATDTARRLRLERDQWRLLAPAYRSYQRAVAPALGALAEAVAPLEDIRAQAGPRPAVLKRTLARFVRARSAVAATNPPPQLAAAHAVLQSAWELANNAVRLRLRAVEEADGTRAAEASAAAAGALMLAARARDDIALAVKEPTLP